MNKEIIVSIIIATYNSENTIWRTFKSIKEQTFDRENVEVLVIDGGSTDNTRQIARGAGAKVIDNPDRLPEKAKIIGVKNAKGKYILIMDSDETFYNKHILQKRINILENIPGIMAIQGGYCQKKNMKTGACSQYINAVGDPFSCFIYQTYRGGSMPGLIIRKGLYNKEYDCYIAHFGKNDIKPIGDSVTMMNRQYVMGHYSELLEQGETTAFIYDCIVSDTGCTAFVRDDYNYHYSNSSLKTYFSKLKFRVINNIFDVKGSGYAAKAEYNTQLNRRKYFYPFYTVSTVVPIIHGIYMSFVYRHPVFLLHPIFAWYVLIEVVVQYSKKILGKISVNTSYAK